MLPCTVSSHVCAGLNQCNTKTHTILSPCLYPPAIKHNNVNPLMNLAYIYIYRKRTSILGDVTEMWRRCSIMPCLIGGLCVLILWIWCAPICANSICFQTSGGVHCWSSHMATSWRTLLHHSLVLILQYNTHRYSAFLPRLALIDDTCAVTACSPSAIRESSLWLVVQSWIPAADLLAIFMPLSRAKPGCYRIMWVVLTCLNSLR